MSRTATVTDRRENPWQYRHNPSGQLLRFTDPTGVATAYVVDGEGLVTRVTAPLGRVTAIAYDTSGERRARGNVLSVSVTADSRGDNGSAHTLQTTYEYESYANQPTVITDPRGAVTKIVRNEVGLATSVTEAFGAPEAGTTTTQYNAFGQPTRVTNPNGHVTTYDYFATGPEEGYLQRQTVDPEGLALTTAFDVDERGNVLAVTDARGVRHESVYNELDWLVETTQAASGATSANDPEGLAPALGLQDPLPLRRGRPGHRRAPAGGRRRGEPHPGPARLRRPGGGAGGAPGGDGGGRRLDRLAACLRRELEPDDDHRAGGRGDRADLRREESPRLGDSRHAGHPKRRRRATPTTAKATAPSSPTGAATPTRTAFDGFGRVKSATDPLGNRTAMTYDNGSNVVDSRSFDSGGALLAASGSTFDLRGRPNSALSRLWSGSDPAGARVLDLLDDLRPGWQRHRDDRRPGPRLAPELRCGRAPGDGDRSGRQPDRLGARPAPATRGA